MKPWVLFPWNLLMYIIKANNEVRYSEHAVLFERYSHTILLCISHLVRKLVITWQRKFSKEMPLCDINLLSLKTSTQKCHIPRHAYRKVCIVHIYHTGRGDLEKPMSQKHKATMKWQFPSTIEILHRVNSLPLGIRENGFWSHGLTFTEQTVYVLL